jgi:tetratricopeptide (TPR) repeat protein
MLEALRGDLEVSAPGRGGSKRALIVGAVALTAVAGLGAALTFVTPDSVETPPVVPGAGQGEARAPAPPVAPEPPAPAPPQEESAEVRARALLERARVRAHDLAPLAELSELLAEAERLAPTEDLRAEVQLDLATYTFRRGGFEEATRLARSIRAPGRLGLQARYLAAYGQLWQDRYDEGLGGLEALWRADPDGVVGQNAGAVFNSHTGRNDVGEKLARAALALDPSYVDAYCSLAFCLNDLSHRQPERKHELLDASLRASTEASRLAPDHPRPYLARAFALGNVGRPREALAAYDALIRLTEPRPMARALRHRARYRIMLDGDHEGALRDLERALDRDRNDVEALLWRGVLREQRGDREGAARDWVLAARSSRQALNRALGGMPAQVQQRVVEVLRQRLR